MTHFVYFLADPRYPRRPRYVGLTCNPAARQKKHASLIGASTNAAFYAWKKELRDLGLSAVLHIVAQYPSKEEGRAAEWRLIHRWRRRGLCDCNGKWDGSFDAWALQCRGMNQRLGVLA